MGWLRAVGKWLEERLGVRDMLRPMLEHPIPRGSAGPMGWWYVLGSASLTMLMLQILTGILLAFVYVPAADKAYESLLYMNDHEQLGWFLRALHYYAGSAMVVLLLAHMTQVFLHGAFKYPRELTWLVGVVLLLLTMGMFFTGQVLRWDPDAYWGIGVGASMAGRVPVAGPAIVHMMLGGPTIGGDTLSRFFALHVFIIPGLLLTFLGIHLWLVLRKGISEPPVPGEVVDPKTYHEEYEKKIRDGVPFFGDAAMKDGLFSAIAVLVVVVIAVVLGPKGPSGPPDPSISGANPRPEWPFLWLFALLSLSPPESETFIILVFPLLVIGALFLVPFISNRGERAPSRRPLAVLLVIVVYTLLGVLTWEGISSPWSPDMTAWSGTTMKENLVRDRTPLELQGAVVFQNKQCRNCHALEGTGGRRGPDLWGVGTRLTRDQIIDQVSNGTPGGGNMPAYGKQMKPAEMAAVTEFLVSLRPADRPAARPASDNPPATGERAER
jgi:ubiquinol-cytochrome c reductase cytochrome b subunit